jgi:hypothetical protein
MCNNFNWVNWINVFQKIYYNYAYFILLPRYTFSRFPTTFTTMLFTLIFFYTTVYHKANIYVYSHTLRDWLWHDWSSLVPEGIRDIFFQIPFPKLFQLNSWQYIDYGNLLFHLPIDTSSNSLKCHNLLLRRLKILVVYSKMVKI